ncbi:hypothetical protein PG985_006498 [Apiospora marii]|uniref:Uncharacterized protein n=1 Tax=Apiospora marii TaxID=335849 RepID=A0ABR1S7Z0_9PEZI
MFADPLSDHITLLKIFHAFCAKNSMENADEREMALWCKEHMLDLAALREARANRVHLVASWRKMYPKDDVHQSYSITNEDYSDRLRQALARGLFINTAYCRLEDQHITVHGNYEGLIEPLSRLTGVKHEWIVYSKFYLGVKAYFYVATAMKPEWIEDLPYFHPDRLPQRFDMPKRLKVSKSLEAARQKKTWFKDLDHVERSAR